MVTKNIVYILPKTITTQKLNGKTIQQAFDNVSRFLINCTTANPLNPSGDCSLTAYSAYRDVENPKIGEQNVSDIQAIFGEGVTNPLSYNYPSGIPSKETRTEWKISPNDFQKALKFLINGQPWPKYTFGPVELVVGYWFKFINPDTKQVLTNQKDESLFMTWFSRSRSCSATFSFPFKEPNSEFEEYIAKIEPYFPFNFERKHLRIAAKSEKKDTYSYRKL